MNNDRRMNGPGHYQVCKVNRWWLSAIISRWSSCSFEWQWSMIAWVGCSYWLTTSQSIEWCSCRMRYRLWLAMEKTSIVMPFAWAILLFPYLIMTGLNVDLRVKQDDVEWNAMMRVMTQLGEKSVVFNSCLGMCHLYRLQMVIWCVLLAYDSSVVQINHGSPTHSRK